MEHSEKDIDTLYKDNVDALYLYARNLGYDKQLAIDAIHDVFCKIFASNRQLRDISNIKSYLFKASIADKYSTSSVTRPSTTLRYGVSKKPKLLHLA